MTRTIELDVNGRTCSIVAHESTPLIYVLRNDLKLKGTRYGCGQGACGSCTILIDGRSVQSCNTPLSAAQGRQITTIEGLGGHDPLHPLQQAFIDEQAGQCGYCLSGILMAARRCSIAIPLRQMTRFVAPSTRTCAAAGRTSGSCARS